MTSPQGTMPAPGPMKENMKGNLFRDPTTMFKMLDALSTQYVGEATFGEKPVEELIIAGDKFSYHLYLDKETFLPLGVKYSTVGQQGPTEVEEHFSDYRDVGGLMIPFKTVAFDKGEKSSEIVLLEVESDVEVDMSIFEKK